MTDQHLRDVANLVEANSRLAESLAQSQSALLVKAEAFNTSEAVRWRHLCHYLLLLVLILSALVGVLLWRADMWRTQAIDDAQIIWDYRRDWDKREKGILDFIELQKQFNKTVTGTLEELTK